MLRRFHVVATIVALLAPTIACAMDDTKYWMWEVLELRSYGEERHDLTELLVPWLARIHFYDTTRHSSIQIEEDALVYSDPDGDFIGITGRFNCISVAYYTTPAHKIIKGKTERERSDAFELALTEFLENLPTPRLTHRIVAGTQTCGDAI